MYKITAEVTRRTVKVVVVSTLGPPVIACWQAAAKKLDRKSDRLELWNTLFTTALHEDIWELFAIWQLVIATLRAHSH
jgi:N-terminal acetyltransferase B complex non-catalytic subunit